MPHLSTQFPPLSVQCVIYAYQWCFKIGTIHFKCEEMARVASSKCDESKTIKLPFLKRPVFSFVDPSNARAKFFQNHLLLVSSLALLLFVVGYDPRQYHAVFSVSVNNFYIKLDYHKK